MNIDTEKLVDSVSVWFVVVLVLVLVVVIIMLDDRFVYWSVSECALFLSDSIFNWLI